MQCMQYSNVYKDTSHLLQPFLCSFIFVFQGILFIVEFCLSLLMVLIFSNGLIILCGLLSFAFCQGLFLHLRVQILIMRSGLWETLRLLIVRCACPLASQLTLATRGLSIPRAYIHYFILEAKHAYIEPLSHCINSCPVDQSGNFLHDSLLILPLLTQETLILISLTYGMYLPSLFPSLSNDLRFIALRDLVN